jgi:D-3-phosphoglycerate dehydrogenase
MSLLVFDPHLDREWVAEAGAVPASLSELMRQSDFLTIHCPLEEETRCLIGEKEFSAAKAGLRLVNCARGGIVDEAALYRAIVDGRVAGAALDVFEKEPPEGCHLLDLDRVVVTPHLGASTQEAQVRVAVSLAEDLLRVFRGEEPDSPVNRPAKPGG